MRDGRPRGTPLRVKQDLGRNALLTGFTAAGQLTMIVTGEGTPSDLFVLSVDPATGEARGELTAYARYPTDHFFPRWSPDGSRVAYTSRKGQVRRPNLFVGSLDGEERGRDPRERVLRRERRMVARRRLAPLPGLRPSGRAGRHLPGPAGQPPDRAPPSRRTVGARARGSLRRSPVAAPGQAAHVREAGGHRQVRDLHHGRRRPTGPAGGRGADVVLDLALARRPTYRPIDRGGT